MALTEYDQRKHNGTTNGPAYSRADPGSVLIKHGSLRHTWWEPGRASLVWQFRCTDLPARSEQVKENFGTDPPGRFDQLPLPCSQRAEQHDDAYITAEGIPC